MSLLEDAQSIESADSIGLGDLDQPEDFNPVEEDGDCDDEACDLDPRVQVELEKLNEATEVINKYEAQLDEAKAAGRHAFCEMTRKLQELAEKSGKCIPKARPYYEARVELKKAQSELQQAALLFEKANAGLKASKEMVKHTEDGLTRQGGKLDETWQEMLNYSTKKVIQNEDDVRQRQREHWQASKVYAETEIKVRLLEKKFKSSISKSKQYYELRSKMNHFVEREKLRVHQLEESICHAKSAYSEGLTNLEGISEQIHLKRRLKDSPPRDSGCGTISDSASVNGSIDVASIADVTLEEKTSEKTSAPFSEKTAVMLQSIFHQTNVSASLSVDGRSRSHTQTALLPPTITSSISNAQSYPLLSALEKELNRLQIEKTNPKRVLQTVTSVDSAMDSGSECEDFDVPDDEMIGGLRLDQLLNF